MFDQTPYLSSQTVFGHPFNLHGHRTFTDAGTGKHLVAFGFEMAQLSMGAALQPLSWIFGGSPFSPHRERRDGVEI